MQNIKNYPMDGASLLSVSDLTGELICKHLNRSSLLTLRQVCRRSKSWVESQKILKNIPIEIQYSRTLQAVLESRVPWNNFSIIFEHLDVQSYLSKLIESSGPRIRVLKIKSPYGYRRKIDFLLACPSLEVVCMSDMNFGEITPDELKILFRNFKNLKDLQIEGIHNTTRDIVDIVMQLLTTSTNLVRLQLPVFRWDALLFKPVRRGDCFGQIFKTKVIKPVVVYLDSRRKNSPKLPNLKFLDIDHLVGGLSDFNMESFQVLAAACGRSNTRLMNVSQFLLYRADVKSFQLPLSSLQTIHSLEGFQKGIDFNGMVNLKELKVILTPLEAGSDTDLQFDYHFPLPGLETLDVTLMFNIDNEPLPAMVRGLFQTDRASVTKLAITWNLQTPLIILDVNDLVKRFPNVRHLELIGCPAKDEELIVILKGMKFLESLKIKDCNHITDLAFEGIDWENPDPLLELKHLKKLWIRSFRNSGITDQSCIHVFSKMAIRQFTFHTVGPPNITTNGLAALCRGEPFRRTIEYLEMVKPVRVTDQCLHKMTRELPNLKRGFQKT